MDDDTGIDDERDVMRRGCRRADETGPVAEHAVQRLRLGASGASEVMRGRIVRWNDRRALVLVTAVPMRSR